MNGRNLLSVDYDRSLKTEKIYDDHRKFLLKIVYDTQGHPTLWVPSSKLLSVNLTYSRSVYDRELPKLVPKLAILSTS